MRRGKKYSDSRVKKSCFSSSVSLLYFCRQCWSLLLDTGLGLNLLHSCNRGENITIARDSRSISSSKKVHLSPIIWLLLLPAREMRPWERELQFSFWWIYQSIFLFFDLLVTHSLFRPEVSESPVDLAATRYNNDDDVCYIARFGRLRIYEFYYKERNFLFSQSRDRKRLQIRLVQCRSDYSIPCKSN